jgi:hypothetical protein
MRLSEWFQTQDSFSRSINISGDLKNLDLAQHYLWSKQLLQNLQQILSEIDDPTKQAAVSITGPFGSGKSAFVLQFMQLFGAAGSKAYSAAVSRLESNQFIPSEHEALTISPLVVPVVGRQAPLGEVVLESIRTYLRAERLDTKAVSRRIKAYLNGDSKVPLESVFEAIEEAVSSRHNGIFLLLDECGKFLEYAALHPSRSDIYFLQQLAELRKPSSRFQILTLTIFHQSFQGYAQFLGERAQGEWSKIQGRFCNLNLTYQVEQTIPLISRVIGHDPGLSRGKRNDLKKLGKELFEGFSELKLESGSLYGLDLKHAISESLPLHPLALLILPYISQISGQNTRSVFTFLNHHTPSSLPRFLETQQATKAKNLPLLGLDILFDYFSEAGFDRSGGTEHRLREIIGAIERLGSPLSTEEKVLKCIGLLNLLQLPNLFPANNEVLEFALSGTGVDVSEVQKGIESLIDQSFIVYRHFSKEYRIWEGSDFRIDEELTKRKQNLNAKLPDLIAELQNLDPLKYLIARKHFEETGTLRSAGVNYIGLRELMKELDVLDNDLAKGHEAQILVCVCSNQDEYQQAEARLNSPGYGRKNWMYFLLQPDISLFHHLREAFCLQEILATEPSVATDHVAQRELKDRIRTIEDGLSHEIQQNIWSFQNELVRIFSKGKEVTSKIRSMRMLYRHLSDLFDVIYESSPVIHNELMNRFKISPPVSLARRQLMIRILTQQGIPELGIEPDNYSAEATLYRLTLKAPGFYRADTQSEWGIQAPAEDIIHEDNRYSWYALWSDLHNYLTATEEVSCENVLEHFQAPPYGLRPPIISLLLAIYLESKQCAVSLYDDGNYIPKRDEVLYEIFFRRPIHFSFRRLSGTRSHQHILQALGEALKLEGAQEFTLLSLFEVIQALYRRIRRLPALANTTRLIPPNVQEFRDAILRASRPEELLFKLLPKGLGINPEVLLQQERTDLVEEYVNSFMKALSTLATYKDEVRAQSLGILSRVWGISTTDPISQRRQFVERSGSVLKQGCEPKVEGLSKIMNDEELKPHAWIDKVLGFIAGRPLDSWGDFDRNDFENKARNFYRQFHNYELLVLDQTNDGRSPRNLLRYSLTSSDGFSREEVVWPKADAPDIARALKKIELAVKNLDEQSQAQALLLALKSALQSREEGSCQKKSDDTS